jgi:hypothetical protein
MRKVFAVCTLMISMVIALPHRAVAQDDMKNGTWRGWLLQQDQDSIQVTYAITHYDKHLLITLRGRSGITYDMVGAKVKDDVLTFDWPMGLTSTMFCRLTRRDGKSFEGTCNDRSPGPVGKPTRVWMLMNPPDSGRGGRGNSPRPDSTTSRLDDSSSQWH